MLQPYTDPYDSSFGTVCLDEQSEREGMLESQSVNWPSNPVKCIIIFIVPLQTVVVNEVDGMLGTWCLCSFSSIS